MIDLVWAPESVVLHTSIVHRSASAQTNVDAILREGLTPNQQGDVYTSENLTDARQFAYPDSAVADQAGVFNQTTRMFEPTLKPGTTGAVLEVRIPASEAEHIRIEDQSKWSASRWNRIIFKGHIKPEWIRLHSVIAPDGSWRVLAAASAVSYYIGLRGLPIRDEKERVN